MLKNIRSFPLIFIILISAILRFYNLLHDAPYFFNPDERNMAIAISQFRLPGKLSEIPICLISQIRQNPTNSQPALRLRSGQATRNQQLDNCNLNPHFFAYGQFPLYLAFISDQITKPLFNIFTQLTINPGSSSRGVNNQQSTINNYLSTSHPSAIFWLRFWSALSSVLTILFVYLISKQIFDNQSTKLPTTNYQLPTIAAILAAFSPGLIQSAHFGTTESLLTFFFLASTYFSIRLLTNPYRYSVRKYLIRNSKFIILNSLVVGLAIGTKFTGIIFLAPPLLSLMIQIIRVLRGRKRNKIIVALLHCFIAALIIIGSIIFSIISSPYNLIDLQGFKGSVFGYEADVALGKYEAFYTRQFVATTPILFQMEKIFPYALGWPIFILASIGLLLIMIKLFHSLILLIWNRIMNHELRIKNKKNIDKLLYHDSYFLILASSFLIYFLPNAFLFAKWTRFMTPILPFFAVFAGYFLYVILGILSLSKETPESFTGDSGQARLPARPE